MLEVSHQCKYEPVLYLIAMRVGDASSGQCFLTGINGSETKKVISNKKASLFN
jgi:hypothetical protein